MWYKYSIPTVAACMLGAVACAPTVQQTSGPMATALTPPPPSASKAKRVPETMSYDGVFPCTDCQSLRVTLNLRDDGTFMLRCIFSGRADGTDSWYVDLGHWAFADNKKKLVLYGGYIGTRELAVDDENTLRFLDFDGKALSNQITKQTISRKRPPDVFLEPFRLWGTYIFVGGKGVFTESRTGSQFVVAERDEEALLRQEFTKGAQGCLRPLWINVLGHFEARVGPDGQMQEMLIVDRFEELVPGECKQGPPPKGTDSTTDRSA